MKGFKIIGILVLSTVLLPLSNNAFVAQAQESITISVDRESFAAGDTVVITGTLEGAEEGTPVAIEVRDAEGQTLVVRTVSTDADGDYRLEFKIPESAPAGNFTIFANAQVEGQTVTNTKVVDVASQQTSESPTGSNSQCLIATAAFGSELAPQVQFLRNFRDHHILSTAAGSSFMNVFNAWYYSFSPNVADYERGQPWLQQTVRVAIYPLLGILAVSEKAYFAIPGEYGALSAGLIASSLIGGVYATPMALTVRRIRTVKLDYRLLISVVGILSASVVASFVINSSILLMVTTSLLVVSTIAISAIVSSSYLSRLIQKIVQKIKNQ